MTTMPRVTEEGWSRKFEEPIDPPNDRQLVAYRRDAGAYITKLPKVEHSAPQWQAAMEALIPVAERNGPTCWRGLGL
jgi:hypothetical protein